MSNDESQIQQAWSQTVTPYSQIKDTLGPTKGQYDFVVKSLTPGCHKNGMYIISGEFNIHSPTGFQFPYKRDLFIGTKKDNLAQLPETRLNSPALRFLKNIAAVNKLPTNDQTDAALCASILGKGFGCRLEDAPYTDVNGQKKTGTDFGRNVTVLGAIPARVDGTPLVNGQAGAPSAAPSVMAGASFGVE